VHAASPEDAEAESESGDVAALRVAKCKVDGGLREWASDLPVMPEGIDDAAQTPAMFFGDCKDL
jgi:hypothetical protein